VPALAAAGRLGNRELNLNVWPYELMPRVYAVVSYDFQAERPDELDAKKGEAIVVIAQSNHEWWVEPAASDLSDLC